MASVMTGLNEACLGGFEILKIALRFCCVRCVAHGLGDERRAEHEKRAEEYGVEEGIKFHEVYLSNYY